MGKKESKKESKKEPKKESKKEKTLRSERRRYARIELKEAISVRFKVVSQAEGQKVDISNGAKTKNVSGGGMFLEMPLLKPKLLEGLLRGTHNLLLEINTPASSHLIKALSKVVWVEGKTPDRYGVGISFLSISEEDQDKLTKCVIDSCLRK